MAVDVINYPGLLHLEQKLHLPVTDQVIGQFYSGQDTSQRVGSGFEVDGLIEYDGTRDAKNIDWVQSMRFGNDVDLLERQFYNEQSPLTVFVSDIPTHERYARTLGVVMSARALGFVAAHVLLRGAEKSGAPLMVNWSDGMQYPKNINGIRMYEGKNAAKKAIVQGLAVAKMSTERAQQPAVKQSRFARKKSQSEGIAAEQLQTEQLQNVLVRAQRRSRQIADMARFVVVSDFRSGFSDLQPVLRSISRDNEVITIQITHPVLRGEGLKVGDVLATGSVGQNIILDTPAQLQKYSELAIQRQRTIDEGLKKASSHTIKLDTAVPGLFTRLR